MNRAEEILEFWFGHYQPSKEYFAERMHLWFGGTPEIDENIRRRFETDVQQAAAGQLSSWEEDPRSCLALIVLLDQFSLNIYRDEPRSFEQSAMAIPIAERALARGFDQKVPVIMRAFFYLPFEHGESIDDQERSVALFERLAQDSPDELKELTAGFHHYAILHWEVIDRFGRFPDRNPIFGRPHTPEEVQYMADGGPPF